MWHTTPEIPDEMTKIKRREILSKYLQQLAEKMEFSNGQQDIIIYQTSIARQVRLVDRIKH